MEQSRNHLIFKTVWVCGGWERQWEMRALLLTRNDSRIGKRKTRTETKELWDNLRIVQ